MTREELTRTIRDAVEALECAQAMWLAGSDAFERVDRFSDLDVSVLAPVDRSGEVFEAVEAALAPIELTWRVPEPTWHGHRQRFYRLERAGPHLLVDLSVMRADRLDPWLHPGRHGTPVVLFDRTGALEDVPESIDDDLTARFDTRLQQSVVRFRLMARTMVERSVGRGKTVEAIWAWQGFVIGPLVEVLRARHAPERQDFGLRYTDLDLPPRVYHRLAELVLVGSLPDLVMKLRRAEKLFDDTVEALVADGRLYDDGRTGTF